MSPRFADKISALAPEAHPGASPGCDIRGAHQLAFVAYAFSTGWQRERALPGGIPRCDKFVTTGKDNDSRWLTRGHWSVTHSSCHANETLASPLTGQARKT